MDQHTDSKTKGTALVVKAGAKRRKGGRARAVLDRPPPRVGWRSTDDEEIELRRWRGRTEIAGIEALESKQPFFGTFRVQSGSGSYYDVELRDTPKPALTWPAKGRRHESVQAWLDPFLETDGTLTSDPARVEALISAWHFAPIVVRNRVRVSRHFAPWLDRLRR